MRVEPALAFIKNKRKESLMRIKPPEITVRVFLGNKHISTNELNNITIKSGELDKVFENAVKRFVFEQNDVA